MKICFVCLGNICRSPTAEGVMRAVIEKAGLADVVVVDSAGTGGYHVGELPDPRTRKAARRRGYNLDHFAWQFTARDFTRFDLVLAMDAKNLRHLQHLAETRVVDLPPPSLREGCAPDVRRACDLRLFRSFDASAPDGAEVPDPWYGGDAGFEEVLDQCERACEGLLAHVRSRL